MKLGGLALRFKDCSSLAMPLLQHSPRWTARGSEKDNLAIRVARQRSWLTVARKPTWRGITLSEPLRRWWECVRGPGNIGAAVIDRLPQLGLENVSEIRFDGAGPDADWAGGVRDKTKNKRAEMWCMTRAWLATGAIPDDDNLAADLIGPEYD